MNFKEYVKNAVRTESTFGVIDPDHSIKDINDSLFHSAIWMQTEMWEIFEAIFIKWKDNDIDIVNVKEELWDVLWYFAIACNKLDYYDFDFNANFDGKKCNSIEEYVFSLNDITINILDSMKKSLFYNKDFDINLLKNRLKNLFEYVWHLVKYINWDLEDMGEINIEKLRTRYPEKFTTNDAVNRDLVSERKILEKTK